MGSFATLANDGRIKFFFFTRKLTDWKPKLGDPMRVQSSKCLKLDLEI